MGGFLSIAYFKKVLGATVLLIQSDQTVFNCKANQAHQVMNIQLVHETGTVLLNRFLANKYFLRDHVIRITLGDQLKNFSLAWRQTFVWTFLFRYFFTGS